MRWRKMSLNFFNLIAFLLSSAFAYDYGYNKPDYTNNCKRVEYEHAYSYKNLVPVYEAKNVEFGFPSEIERNRALASGRYVPDNAIPLDVDVHFSRSTRSPRVFMTVPRFGKGIPYSLGYITDVMRPNGSEIQPYPDYSWQSSHGADCNGLTSVYRIQIDSCNQLWVLDSGEIDYKQHCPPSVVVFDLETDKMVHRYFLPEETYKPKISRFVTPVVDIADPAPYGNCKAAILYLADPTGAGFVVYDFLEQKSWRIENKYTVPDLDFTTHTINGESFELLDGVFGFALTPRDLGLERMLYFHALSHDMLVAIPLTAVNNETIWKNGITSGLNHFIPLGRRGVQCGAPAMTRHGFILCGFMEPVALFGWNIRTAYKPQNLALLAENPVTLQFVSGMKIINNPYSGKDEVWAVSNSLQKAFTGTINYNEINYRIQRCGVDELLLGQRCKY